MIYRYTDAAPVEVMPGLLRRTLVTGKSMMICEFTLIQVWKSRGTHILMSRWAMWPLERSA